MSKYRSKVNYADIYNSDRGGINLGIDSAVFLKLETTPRVFSAPSIGTQGKSESGATAVTDISALSDTNFRISVDGGAVISVTLTNAGKTSGALIAAELESKINTALIAAGQSGRVWVEYSGSKYYVYSQSVGTDSSVVITDGLTLNIADDLELGIANSGAEAVGTNDEDFLLYTTGGMNFSQGIESNAHRSGRFHTGVVKAKKMAEWNLSTYVNMNGLAGDSIDKAVKLLWKQLLGTETVVASTAIKYTQGLPNSYMSMVRVSTIFGEYYRGGYVKDMTMTFAGDAPATCEWSGKASTRVIAGLSKVNGAVSANANVVVEAGQTNRYDLTAPVMVVSDDGLTVLHGADGSLTIASITALSNTLTLSSPVTVPDNGFIVPWNPAAFSSTGRDAIATDLAGSFRFTQAGIDTCITNAQLTFTNEHYDFDNCFGSDANLGYAAANRLTMALSITFDLSNENFSEVVQSQNFAGFNPQIILGEVTGRHVKITAPKWIPAVPSIEVPENGVTPVTLEGNLYQSSAGANDPILVEFK